MPRTQASPRLWLLATLCLAFSLTASVSASAQTACGEGAPERTITICAPTEGQQIIGDSVRPIVTITDSGTVYGTKLYLDGNTYGNYSGAMRTIDGRLQLGISYGQHRLTIRTWDSLGFFDKSVNFSRVPGCTTDAPERTMVICEPSVSPNYPAGYLMISAHAVSTGTPTAMKLYVDGVMMQFVTGVEFMDVALPFGPGTHRITVRAWDSLGYFDKTIYKTVE